MLSKQIITPVNLATDDAIVVAEVPAPPRGTIHRVSLARTTTAGNKHLSSPVVVRLYDADPSTWPDPKDGRRIAHQIGAQLSQPLNNLSLPDGHIFNSFPSGLAYVLHGSTRAEKNRTLYVEIEGIGTSSGDYELVLVVSAVRNF